MVDASTRDQAIGAMQNALRNSRIGGVTTTLEFLAAITSSDCKFCTNMNNLLKRHIRRSPPHHSFPQWTHSHNIP